MNAAHTPSRGQRRERAKKKDSKGETDAVCFQIPCLFWENELQPGAHYSLIPLQPPPKCESCEPRVQSRSREEGEDEKLIILRRRHASFGPEKGHESRRWSAGVHHEANTQVNHSHERLARRVQPVQTNFYFTQRSERVKAVLGDGRGVKLLK